MVLYQHSTGEKYLDYLLMVTCTTYSNFLNDALLINPFSIAFQVSILPADVLSGCKATE